MNKNKYTTANSAASFTYAQPLYPFQSMVGTKRVLRDEDDDDCLIETQPYDSKRLKKCLEAPSELEDTDPNDFNIDEDEVNALALESVGSPLKEAAAAYQRLMNSSAGQSSDTVAHNQLSSLDAASSIPPASMSSLTYFNGQQDNSNLFISLESESQRSCSEIVQIQSSVSETQQKAKGKRASSKKNSEEKVKSKKRAKRGSKKAAEVIVSNQERSDLEIFEDIEEEKMAPKTDNLPYGYTEMINTETKHKPQQLPPEILQLREAYSLIVMKSEFENEENWRCDICLSKESEEDDPLYQCDLCMVVVHPTCYRRDLYLEILQDSDREDEPWFCARCKFLDQQRPTDIS